MTCVYFLSTTDDVAVKFNNLVTHFSIQLVKNENLKGVVSMNEDYELKFMAMDGAVSIIYSN